MEKLLEKCKSKLNQPIIRNFLKKKENYHLFTKTLEEPNNPKFEKELNTAFQKHYKSVKILGYLSKLIYFYSIDYDKKSNNYKNKIHSDSNIEQEDQQLTDVYFSSKEDLTFNSFLKYESLLDQIEDESLYQSIKSLKPTQQKILELIYGYGLSNKEVAMVLGKSEQTVSYNHRSALKKIKKLVS